VSVRVFAVTSVYDDPGLLRHFLAHYERLGVDRILIVVRTPLPGALFAQARAATAIVRGAEASWFLCDCFADGEKAAVERDVLRAARAAPDDFVMHLDLDEFHEYPAPLPELVSALSRHRHWVVRGKMVDRVASGGVLAPVRPEPDLGTQFPIGCDLTSGFLGGWTQKIMLCRGRTELKGGLNHETRNAVHDRVPIGSAADYVVHHFKWTAGVDARLRARLDEAIVGPEYRRECARFLESHETAGKIDLDDPVLRARHLGALTYPA
jgi:Glycosyl transferase family 2